MRESISREEKTMLLSLARESIIDVVKGRNPSVKRLNGKNLQTKCGCFVTIQKQGKLRGCIGTFTSDKPLYATVAEMATAAATNDPRFYPLTSDELDSIQLEISILSKLKKIDSIEEIEVGTHGLYIEKNLCRGVLLPQVAIEYGWDRITFLCQTCLKAGLPKDDWKNEADIYVFSADVFGEDHS
jgi:uncharacterized protein